MELDFTNPFEYSDLQKQLYFPNINEELTSRHSYDLSKRSFSSHRKVKMDYLIDENNNNNDENNNENNNEITYIVSKKFDSLINCEMITQLPSVKVKDKYKDSVEICYPHNLGHHIITKGILKINGDIYQTIDSQVLDINSKYYKQNVLYDEMVGNIKCLTQWNTKLPGYPVNTPQPWLFTKNPNTGLLILQTDVNITFTFSRRIKLNELLRMRIRTPSGKCKIVPCNLSYLDLPKNVDEIPIPEMWSKYSLFTDEERRWRKQSLSSPSYYPNVQKIKHEIWYEDYINCNNNNNDIGMLGEVIKIPLKSKSLVRHIFWMGQNLNSIKYNDFSNYTTNTNLFKGFTPCSKISLSYSPISSISSDDSNDSDEEVNKKINKEIYRIKELPYYHFTRSEAYDFFKYVSTEPGYSVYTYGYNPYSVNADSSVDISTFNVNLIIKLEDTDIFNNKSKENDKYIVHVRMAVYRKIEIKLNEENQLVYKLS